MTDSKHPRSAEVLAREEGDSEGIVEETVSMSGGLGASCCIKDSVFSSFQNPGRAAPRVYSKQVGQRVTKVDAREAGTESLTADIWLTALQELPGLKRAAFPKPPACLPKTAAPGDRSWEGRDPL